MELKTILFDALIATILIFVFSYVINAFFDQFRMDDVIYGLNNEELSKDSLELQFLFMNVYHNKTMICNVFKKQVLDYKHLLVQFANSLEGYGSLAKLYAEIYGSLREDLYVTNLNLYDSILELNYLCKGYVSLNPILFIYKINDETDLLQGYALNDFVQKHHDFIVIPLSSTFASKIGLTNKSLIIYQNNTQSSLIVGQKLDNFLLGNKSNH